jgi:predicted enzyme related to lactoylglutathione lyase
MKRQRREILQMVPLAIGASALLNDEMAAAEQAPGAQKDALSGQEKVAGIGGFFFRAHDPDGLAKWYQQHLGIQITPTSENQQVWRQEAGETAFTPFPEKTKYFGDPSKMWMINFRVRDLDKMAAQLGAAGIEVKIDPQTYPYGRFASLNDPEGNPIQLWQPAK